MESSGYRLARVTFRFWKGPLDADPGSAPGRAVDRQLPAHLFDTGPDSPEAEVAGGCLHGMVDPEPRPVVGDRQGHARWIRAVFEIDDDLLRIGVAAGVRRGLLRDAQQLMADLPWKRDGGARHRHRGFGTACVDEAREVTQRLGEFGSLQERRLHVPDGVLHLLARVGDDVPHDIEPGADIPGDIGELQGRVELEDGPREPLLHAVVDLVRQPVSLGEGRRIARLLVELGHGRLELPGSLLHKLLERAVSLVRQVHRPAHDPSEGEQSGRRVEEVGRPGAEPGRENLKGKCRRRTGAV